jgi:hypothetical protein
MKDACLKSVPTRRQNHSNVKRYMEDFKNVPGGRAMETTLGDKSLFGLGAILAPA